MTRPIPTIIEMDELLILDWNNTVKPNDTVYHLGDFTLGGLDIARGYFQQLNGNIKVVPGGHDHRWVEKSCNMTPCQSATGVEIEVLPPIYTLEHRPVPVVMCHYAMRTFDRSHYGSIHLYGHSHGRLLQVQNCLDVGIDNTYKILGSYQPLLLDEAMDIAKTYTAPIIAERRTMKHNFDDLVGRTFGQWTVLGLSSKTSGGNTYWRCQCSCGATSEVQRVSLMHGTSKCCRDCSCKIKCVGNIPLTYHRRMSELAKRRGIDVHVTIQELDDLFVAQNGKCALSGLDIGFHVVPPDKHTQRKSMWRHSASLDRIDSSGIYTIDNIQWLHQSINTMKNTFSQSNFIHLCTLVADNSDDNWEERGNLLWNAKDDGGRHQTK